MRLRHWSLAGGVENIASYFSNVSLRRKFLAVQEEADSSGISDFDNDLAGCPHGGVSGRNQRFVGDGFAVGHDRNPGSLVSADQQGESA